MLEPNEPVPTKNHDASPSKILIVEDDPNLRRMLAKRMKYEGYQILEAEDGQQGVEVFQDAKPDIIMMDAMMPHVDGFSATKQIRQLPDGEYVPILIITALDDADAIDHAFASGATDYLTKPLNIPVLHHRVRHLIAGKKAQEALLRTHMALQNSQRTLETLMSNLPGMAYRSHYKPDWRMDFVSEGSYDLTGYQPSDLVGSHKVSYLDLIHPDDYERVAPVMDKSRETGEPFQITYRLTAADGTEKWVWEQGRRIDDDVHETWEGFITDVTERVKSEEKLAELDMLKSNFLLTMSHELRTPLNSIIGYTSIIQQGILGEVNEKISDRLDRVLRNSQTLLELIEDVLHISSIYTNKITLEAEAIEIPAMLEAALQTYTGEIEAKGLALEREIADDLPLAQADKRGVNRIINNLLTNALKFTDAGSIKVGTRLATEEECQYLKGDSGLLVYVRDTGIGIPPEMHEAIFDEFRQIDNSASREHGGLGVGLALCSKLADIMDGHIWVESTQGEGSTFKVVLPLAS